MAPIKGSHWKLSEATKKRQGLAKIGINNPQWKDDRVGYKALHDWARIHVPNPLTDRCMKCKIIRSLEVANISGNYLRQIFDWEWLCRRCHMVSDGRLKNLKQYKNGIR